ncbi:MAG: hydroxyacid dehydrogenase [Gemmatimonadota bacterium]
MRPDRRTEAPRRVVLADRLAPDGVEILREAEGIEVHDLVGRSRKELLAALPGAAGLVVRSGTTVDEALLAATDGLRVIGRAGVGLDNVDVDAATRRGVAVLNAPAGNTVSTAELTFGLLLASARHIPEADRSLRAGRWERMELQGDQLGGRTLGVLGAGRIGSAVARRGRAFEMRVIVHDPYLPADVLEALGVRPVDLDTLLTEADFLTIHVPATPETIGLIGPEELSRLKPSAYLVNAARGGVVDESALADALAAGRLAGAAVDVFEAEPLPNDHPLLEAPHVILTPHLGAATAAAQREVAVEIAKRVRDALLRGDLSSAVNRTRLDPARRAS